MSTHVPSSYTYMHRTEYENVDGIFLGQNERNAPCAVCYSSIKTVKTNDSG